MTFEKPAQLQDRLVFVHGKRAATPTSERSQIVIDDIIVPIMNVSVPDYHEEFASLQTLERKVPERLPRRR